MRLAIPHDVAAVEANGTWYVGHLVHGGITVLEGSAALIWQAALDGEAEGIVNRVAALSGAEAEEVASEVEYFVSNLVANGLLSERPALNPGSPS